MGGFSLLLVAARARLKMIEGIRAVEFLSIEANLLHDEKKIATKT